MKIPNLYFVTLLAFFLTTSMILPAQKNRIQPGKLYAAGEALFAPRLGFKAVVPEGWEGMLPRETEIFTLNSTTSSFGEIYVFGNEQGNFKDMKEKWISGFNLSESIKLKATNPVVADGLMSSEVIGEGKQINTSGNKAFVVSRCSESGPCVIALLVAPTQFYESCKTAIMNFMKNSSFEPPSVSSLYDGFDWKEFLSNKALMTYQAVQGGKKENYVHLCADGSFTAELKKSGTFKNQNAQYRGKQSGTWSVSGVGEKTTIRFEFKNAKLPAAELELTINDEKIFANGERYFAAKSEKCK